MFDFPLVKDPSVLELFQKLPDPYIVSPDIFTIQSISGRYSTNYPEHAFKLRITNEVSVDKSVRKVFVKDIEIVEVAGKKLH